MRRPPRKPSGAVTATTAKRDGERRAVAVAVDKTDDQQADEVDAEVPGDERGSLGPRSRGGEHEPAGQRRRVSQSGGEHDRVGERGDR